MLTIAQISAGVLGDCWKPEERGKSIGAYTLLPLLGPTLGGILGGYISQHSTWRWAFWSVCLFETAMQLIALVLLHETYGPTILHRRASATREATGNCAYHTAHEKPDQTFTTALLKALRRPIYLLATQHSIQILALYCAVSFGVLYIVLSTLPHMFSSPLYYNQSTSVSGLNFLSIGIGFTVGAQTCAIATDALNRQYSRKAPAQTEVRLLPLLPAVGLATIGLLWYGWSAERRLHWIMPNVGIVIFGAGAQIGTQSVNAYVLDAYAPPGWSASAAAGVWAVKALAGFLFPLFGTRLYDRFDYGRGNTALALTILGLGAPTWFVMWRFGRQLREDGLAILEKAR